jgi:hypothetical protein
MPETPEKEIQRIKEQLDPARLAPRIVNQFIKTRFDRTNYIGGGNTLDCDVMLEVEWNGKRYRLPAFEV